MYFQSKSFLKFILFSSFFFLSKPLVAQESMLSDISYLYMEKLIAVAKENYPKNHSISNRVSIAKNNLASAKTTWLDPFSFSYLIRSNKGNNIDLENANILLSGYQFGVSINPGVLLKKPYQIKNAREELNVALSEKEEYNLQLEAEVKTRYITYLQSLNILKLIAKNMVDIEASFKYVKAKYERSEVTFQDYNTASLSLSTAQQSKIGAEATYAMAKVSLEELLTKKLEEIK